MLYNNNNKGETHKMSPAHTSVHPEKNITHLIFHQRLRCIMTHRDISSRELADLIYVSESTISGYLKGRRLPDLERMRRICIDLEVSADYLLGLKEDTCI